MMLSSPLRWWERRGRRYPSGAHGVAVGTACRLHCDARSRVAPQTRFVRCAHYAQTDAAKSDNEARWRAPTPALRFSSPHKSPLPDTACRDVDPRWHAPLHRALSRPRRLGTGCGAPVRRRGAQGSWPRAQRVRDLTCRRLFERSERSERSEFGDGPRDRAPQGSRPAGPTAEPKRRSLSPGALAARTSTRDRDRQYL